MPTFTNNIHRYTKITLPKTAIIFFLKKKKKKKN